MTAFELHLNFCDGCGSFVEQVRTTATMAQRPVRREQIPQELKAKLLVCIQRLAAVTKAYKFLAADGMGVFSGFVWPLPDGPSRRVGRDGCRCLSLGRPRVPAARSARTGSRLPCMRSSSTAPLEDAGRQGRRADEDA